MSWSNILYGLHLHSSLCAFCFALLFNYCSLICSLCEQIFHSGIIQSCLWLLMPYPWHLAQWRGIRHGLSYIGSLWIPTYINVNNSLRLRKLFPKNVSPPLSRSHHHNWVLGPSCFFSLKYFTKLWRINYMHTPLLYKLCFLICKTMPLRMAQSL